MILILQKIFENQELHILTQICKIQKKRQNGKWFRILFSNFIGVLSRIVN